jgi:hypothetical protein
MSALPPAAPDGITCDTSKTSPQRRRERRENAEKDFGDSEGARPIGVGRAQRKRRTERARAAPGGFADRCGRGEESFAKKRILTD